MATGAYIDTHTGSKCKLRRSGLRRAKRPGMRRACVTGRYVDMMKLAAIGWSECESATGEVVRAVTGGLDIAGKGDPGLDALRRSFEANGVPYETLDRDECARRFPQFRLTPSQEAVYQRDSGVLFATKAVKALWRWACLLGCEMVTNERVASIGDSEAGAFVTTRSGKRFDASHVVVAPGAWLSPLCASVGINMPTRVSEEMVSYWEPKPGSAVDISFKSMPVFIPWATNGLGPYGYYGLPQIDVKGVKCR